jgi:hypothetical protein
MPVIFRYKRFRILFYSNEEKRAHIHAVSNDGEEVKIWLTPEIKIAKSSGVSEAETNEIMAEVKSNKLRCLKAWRNFHGK